MAKEKKYVKVESEKAESNEVYGKDAHGKIIQIEQTGNPKKELLAKEFGQLSFG